MILDPTFFDRFVMGFSLAVHITLATLGVAIPLIIMLAEYLSIRYKDNYYKVLAKRITKAFVVLFAVGVASGLLVAINLLFLWPTFMALVSQVSMAPVYLEVFAFFTETIFLTIYVFYGHVFKNQYIRVLLMGIVAIGGAASAALITVLNAFMNTPVGFNIATYLQTGAVTDVNPLAVFTAPSTGIEVSHVLATSYLAGTGILLAYFSYRLIKNRQGKLRTYYEKAVKLMFAVMLVATMLSVITGVLSIQALYSIQPEKYAAIELNLNSTAFAPEVIFGIYLNGSVHDALFIPDLQSELDGSANAVVPGLNQYPSSTWPPLIIHDMFDFMVFAGFAMGIFMLLVFCLHLSKKRVFESRLVLWLLSASGVLSLILLENGWMVDEFGRQPWIIYNVMLVSQAANQSVSIIPIAILIIIIYAAILPITYFAIRKLMSNEKLEKEL